MVHFLPRYFSAQMIIRTGPNNDEAVPPLPLKQTFLSPAFPLSLTFFFFGRRHEPARRHLFLPPALQRGFCSLQSFADPPQIFTCGITSAQHASREEHPRLGCKAAALLASVIIAWVPLRPWRSGSTLGRMEPPPPHHSACLFLRLPNDEQGLALVPSLRHPVPAPSAS